jgi:hypothetical protein
VFDAGKRWGGSWSVVVPDKGEASLAVVVKSEGVNKPVDYKFDEVVNKKMRPTSKSSL